MCKWLLQDRERRVILVEAGRTLLRASRVIERRNEGQGGLDTVQWTDPEKKIGDRIEKRVGSSADSLILIIIQYIIFSWVLWVGLFVQVKGA